MWLYGTSRKKFLHTQPNTGAVQICTHCSALTPDSNPLALGGVMRTESKSSLDSCVSSSASPLEGKRYLSDGAIR